jgi:hypothetical protein
MLGSYGASQHSANFGLFSLIIQVFLRFLALMVCPFWRLATYLEGIVGLLKGGQTAIFSILNLLHIP